MTSKTSFNEVYRFLDHAEQKNILPANTVAGRRTAMKHILNVLTSEDEQNVEYVSANIEQVMHRFTVKARTEFKAASMEEYKKRFRSVLDDFAAWSEDPATWERSVASRSRVLKTEKTGSGTSSEKSRTKVRKEKIGFSDEAPVGAIFAKPRNGRLVTLALRNGAFEVSIEIPADGLTKLELHRIGLTLSGHLKEEEFKASSAPLWPQIADAELQQHQ